MSISFLMATDEKKATAKRPILLVAIHSDSICYFRATKNSPCGRNSAYSCLVASSHLFFKFLTFNHLSDLSVHKPGLLTPCCHSNDGSSPQSCYQVNFTLTGPFLWSSLIDQRRLLQISVALKSHSTLLQPGSICIDIAIISGRTKRLWPHDARSNKPNTDAYASLCMRMIRLTGYLSGWCCTIVALDTDSEFERPDHLQLNQATKFCGIAALQSFYTNQSFVEGTVLYHPTSSVSIILYLPSRCYNTQNHVVVRSRSQCKLLIHAWKRIADYMVVSAERRHVT